jgi:hypothetical protein
MSALGRPQDMFSDTIQLQPVFAQWIQNTLLSSKLQLQTHYLRQV